jgi:hypothetical protein
MTDQFCTYDISKGLKELGFIEPCFGFYNPEGKFYYGFGGQNGYNYSNFTNKSKSKIILVPIWQQAIDWLLLEYDKDVDIHHWKNQPVNDEVWVNCYQFFINGETNAHYYPKINGAREVGILKTIEIIKKLNETKSKPTP